MSESVLLDLEERLLLMTPDLARAKVEEHRRQMLLWKSILSALEKMNEPEEISTCQIMQNVNGVVSKTNGQLFKPRSPTSSPNGIDYDGNKMTWREVLDFLQENGPTRGKIVAEKLNRTYPSVMGALTTLKKRSLAINDHSSRWHFVTEEIRALPSYPDGPIPSDYNVDYDAEDEEEDEIEEMVEKPQSFFEKAKDLKSESFADDPEAFVTCLATLPGSRRKMVEDTDCTTARDMSQMKYWEFSQRLGVGPTNANHVDDWLSIHFGLTFDRT